MAALPPPPIRTVPEDPEMLALWTNVQKAVAQLPAHFQTSMSIAGIPLEDLFAFNSILSINIERQVVAQLNELRPVWDPEGKYADYAFERQGQCFPDVVLRRSPAEAPIFGIELKGWYALAKERVPSFRFTTTPAACAPWDLIVVVPWIFSDITGGKAEIFAPYVESARYAAEYRNWHWQHAKRQRNKSKVSVSKHTGFYPLSKVDAIADSASPDAGNFGRFARTKLMNPWVTELFAERRFGVPLGVLQQFVMNPSKPDEDVRKLLVRFGLEDAEVAAAMTSLCRICETQSAE